jgi:hypothetical protein
MAATSVPESASCELIATLFRVAYGVPGERFEPQVRDTGSYRVWVTGNTGISQTPLKPSMLRM